jgi:hypothetical protein
MINKLPDVSTTKAATKAIPKFKSDVAERKFWEGKSNDATEYFEASTMKPAKFSNLKSSSKKMK